MDGSWRKFANIHAKFRGSGNKSKYRLEAKKKKKSQLRTLSERSERRVLNCEDFSFQPLTDLVFAPDNKFNPGLYFALRARLFKINDVVS